MIIIPTPMPMMMPSGGGGEPSKGLSIFMSCALVFLFCLLADIILEFGCNKHPVQRILYAPSKCDYVVPGPYRLLHNEASGKYVIAASSYTYLDIDGIGTSFHLLDGSSHFNDSCKAKGALKRYLDRSNFK